jgi:hypothetical protein
MTASVLNFVICENVGLFGRLQEVRLLPYTNEALLWINIIEYMNCPLLAEFQESL